MAERVPYVDPKRLKELYTDQGLSIRATAAEMGVSFGAIRRSLHLNGIEVRESGFNNPAVRQARREKVEGR